MDHFNDVHWIIPSSVFIAGVIGSPHCVSMCGPIVLNFASRKSGLLAYQIGRMLAYCSAGAIVGAIGQSVFGTDRPAWFSSVSLLLIAILLVVNSYRVLAGKSLHFPVPKFLSVFSSKLWSRLGKSSLPPYADAFLAGGLTVFLPCGHLFTFLLGAAATGDFLKGTGFMFAFWLGSTPLLSLGAVWLQKMMAPVARRRWAGMFLFVAGLYGIFTFGTRVQSFEIHSKDVTTQTEKETSSGHCH